MNFENLQSDLHQLKSLIAATDLHVYWGSQIDATLLLPFFTFVSFKQKKQRLGTEFKCKQGRYKELRLLITLCIFIETPWIMGYMRIQNVLCNWLAKNMLHEYISKWSLAGTPLIRGTNLWYQCHKYERCLYLFRCMRASKGVDIKYRQQYSLLFSGIGRNNPPPSPGPFSRPPQHWPSRLNVLDVKRAFHQSSSLLN